MTTRELIRMFFRFVKGGRQYHTVLGSGNYIERVTNTDVHFRTRKGRLSHRISRLKIKAAISYFMGVRTITRNDLEAFSRYNSSLFGLLRYAFRNITKCIKTSKRYWRLSMTDQIHYFSGLCRAPRDMYLAKENGATHILISYFAVREDFQERWLYYARKLGLQIMIDPGEYSRYKAELNGQDAAPITVEEYASFVKRHRKNIHSYLNLDVIGDPAQSEENYRELVKRLGEDYRPIPVWHVQSEWTHLDTIMGLDEPVVAVGGSAFLSEEKRERVFGKLYERYPLGNFHALGLASRLAFSFPWFSSDSSAWLQGRKSHSLLTTNGQVTAPAEWTSDECLCFNVQTLVQQLQHNYDRIFQAALLVKPAHKAQQLCLF